MPKRLEKFNATRDASKLARELFTSVLSSHECDGSDIGYATNAIYVVLLGGKAPAVKKAMNLPTNANFRDNLPLMASERMEEEDRRGRHPCYTATARTASFVKDTFDRERADRQLPKAS